MSTTGFVPTNYGNLIGLGGKLRAGKDVVGDYLEEKHGYVKLGMSDVLNEALLKLNPLIIIEKDSPLYKDFSALPVVRYADMHLSLGYVEAKKNPEVRRLLQVLGTEVGRDMIDPDVWVRMAEKKIQDLWAEGKSVVITAMRFPNEIDMLNRLGGLSVWIERPDEERLNNAGEAIQSHASENSVSSKDFSYVMMNDGTLEQLYRKVEKRLVDNEFSSQFSARQEALSHIYHPPYDR